MQITQPRVKNSNTVFFLEKRSIKTVIIKGSTIDGSLVTSPRKKRQKWSIRNSIELLCRYFRKKRKEANVKMANNMSLQPDIHTTAEDTTGCTAKNMLRRKAFSFLSLSSVRIRNNKLTAII